MGDDDAAARDVGRNLGQPVRDVLVRQTVKSVAANTLGIELLGKGVTVGDLWVPAMKSRVEASQCKS
jgi:hypothetical protein